MNVLELVQARGIDPKRVSSNNGGEYHSACPMCGDGGKGQKSNRFHVWPAQNEGAGTFWCRQCDLGGDDIALVMAMDGVPYREACAVLGIDAKEIPPVPITPRGAGRQHETVYTPSEYQLPEDKWRHHGEKLCRWAHEQLIEKHPEQMNNLAERGLDPGTVIRWGLGWNPGKDGKDLFRAREAWGLPTEYKDIGDNKKRKKKLWIPRGLVISYRRDGVLQRIRIRRPAKFLTNDFDQRYFVLPGSSAMPMLIGKSRRVYMVVETELDGLLIDQAASELVGVLALGSSSNMPDSYCHPHMAQALAILNALDFDRAGGKSWTKWEKAYRQSRRWPVPVGKDPGDAFKDGIDIFTWVLAGMPAAWRIGQTPFARKGLQVAGGGPAVEDKASAAAVDSVSMMPDTVTELGELLKRFPLQIINTEKRTALQNPKSFRNDNVCNRASILIYQDPDCVAYLADHPDELIDGRNFYHA